MLVLSMLLSNNNKHNNNKDALQFWQTFLINGKCIFYRNWILIKKIWLLQNVSSNIDFWNTIF